MHAEEQEEEDCSFIGSPPLPAEQDEDEEKQEVEEEEYEEAPGGHEG